MSGAQINAGVLLSLKDQYSSGVVKAGSTTKSFGADVTGTMDKINKATSGVMAKLGGVGLTIGAGAAINNIINYDARITRLGTSMNMSAKEANDMKKAIMDVSTDADIKINPAELTAAIEQIGELTGDTKFAKENMRTLGLAMQATGASGAEIGGMAAELQKMGLSADEVAGAMGTLTAQGKAGAFTLANFATMGPRLYAAYGATGRTGKGMSDEIGAVMQVIRRGTGSSEQAATAFEAMMRNLTDPVKQKELKKMGISVRDSQGHFRSLVDIMPEIVAKGKSLEKLGTIFDSEAMRAFNSSITEFQKTGAVTSIEGFLKVQGDANDLLKDSSINAHTMKANIENLQTSFGKFADNNLSKPLEGLNNVLNDLAGKPKEVQKLFTTIAVGLGTIVAIKGVATVTTLLKNIKDLKAPSLNGGLSGGGSAGALPVLVTNWPAGGVGGGTGNGAIIDQPGVPNTEKTPSAMKAKADKIRAQRAARSTALKGAGAALAVSALVSAPGLIMDATDPTLSNNEKGKSIGQGAGSLIGGAGGAIGGALAGAAIGTLIPVPVVGTIVGGLVGAGIGLLGGWLGGEAGKAIGDAVTKGPIPPPVTAQRMDLSQLPPSVAAFMTDKQNLAASQKAPYQDGVVTQNLTVTLRDDRADVSVKTDSNMPNWYTNTGRASVARGNQ